MTSAPLDWCCHSFVSSGVLGKFLIASVMLHSVLCTNTKIELSVSDLQYGQGQCEMMHGLGCYAFCCCHPNLTPPWFH